MVVAAVEEPDGDCLEGFLRYLSLFQLLRHFVLIAQQLSHFRLRVQVVRYLLHYFYVPSFSLHQLRNHFQAVPVVRILHRYLSLLVPVVYLVLLLLDDVDHEQEVVVV